MNSCSSGQKKSAAHSSSQWKASQVCAPSQVNEKSAHLKKKKSVHPKLGVVNELPIKAHIQKGSKRFAIHQIKKNKK